MSIRRGWLPREGFTADVVQALVKKTLLNPTLTLPLLLLARYTRIGQNVASGHERTLGRLRLLAYVGLARWLNGILNRGVLNNWQGAKWDWSKEIVLLTGGSDGLGKEMVLLLAAKNIKVVILDIQPPTYDLPNANIHYHHCDLTSPDSITSIASEVRSIHGPPTILINNAGLANGATILSTPDHALERVFALNTLAHFRLCREFLPHMIARNHGMVVTISSLSAFVTPPHIVDYACTKAAALSFHEGLAVELKTRYNAPKVRTLCICPNWARTKLSEGCENRSTFLSPTLYPETVAEAVVEGVLSGTSGVVYLPRVHEWFAATVRGWPWWMQVGLRNATQHAVKDGMGRQDYLREGEALKHRGKEAKAEAGDEVLSAGND